MDAWREIYPNSVQFGCRRQMEPLPAITLKDHNSIQLNLRLFYLKNNFKGNRITVQHAKPLQLIDIFPEKFGSRKNLEGLIFNHCYLNFLNFSDIEFIYEALEKELSGILIQGKNFSATNKIS